MSPRHLNFEQLEGVYALIAAGADEVGPDKTQLFLAKLALVLAREVGDLEVVRAAIANASRDLV